MDCDAGRTKPVPMVPLPEIKRDTNQLLKSKAFDNTPANKLQKYAERSLQIATETMLCFLSN